MHLYVTSSFVLTIAIKHSLPFNFRLSHRGGQVQGGWVGPTSFGINYGSISFGQLSGYIVFCILLIGGASPPK